MSGPAFRFVTAYDAERTIAARLSGPLLRRRRAPREDTAAFPDLGLR